MATEELNLRIPPKLFHARRFNVENANLYKTQFELGVNTPNDFPYVFDSFTPGYALHSPVECASSAKAGDGTAEDDLFAVLTQLHHSTELPERRNCAPAHSPQSIIGGLRRWSDLSAMSGNGSPTGPSQFPSPPTTPYSAVTDTRDLIYEVAGQIAKMNMNSEATNQVKSNYPTSGHTNYNRGCLAHLQGPNHFSTPAQPNFTLLSNSVISQISSTLPQQVARPQPLDSRRMNDLLRKEKLFLLNVHQQKKQVQNLDRAIEFQISRGRRAMLFPHTSCVPMHDRSQNEFLLINCSAPCKFSLCRPNVKKASAGTGVFLPRSYGKALPPGKKSGYSTFLPFEAEHALNMDYEIKKNPFHAQFDSVLSANYETKIPSRSSINQEGLLPQEWTY